MSLNDRATRIISGKTTLEEELETASSTEWCGLCLITGRVDRLQDEDSLKAWRRLDDEQRTIVGRHNRSAAFELRGQE